MEEKLSQGPTIVFYIDGFGYKMFEYAVKNNSIPFIGKNFTVKPLWSVDPPVTNPAMATMISGKEPIEHGVHSRKDRMLKCDTIFSKPYESVAFLEGDSVILKTQLRPKLHIFKDGKSADYWTYTDALKEAQNNTYFIFTHFHEVDDNGHEYGPYSKQVLEKLSQIDSFIEKICHYTKSNILLVSDHGIHEENGAGNHGNILLEEKSEKEEQYIQDHLALWGIKNVN